MNDIGTEIMNRIKIRYYLIALLIILGLDILFWNSWTFYCVGAVLTFMFGIVASVLFFYNEDEIGIVILMVLLCLIVSLLWVVTIPIALIAIICIKIGLYIKAHIEEEIL